MLASKNNLWAAVLLCAPSSAAGQTPAAAEAAAALPMPALESGLLDSWSEHIRPTHDELAWESIGWLPTFADGVRAADAAGRPLLLWAMNGHPLGCT